MGALRDPQYEKFALELAELKPAIEAYKLAGFVPHRGNAARLARKTEIKARVAELLNEAAEYSNIRRVRVLVEIDRVGRANLADFYEPDGRTLKNIKELPRELTAALAAVEWESDGEDEDGKALFRPKIKLHDKNQANFALLKHLGGLPDDDLGKRAPNIFDVLNVDDQRVLIATLEAISRGPRVIDHAPQGERGEGGTAP